MKDMASIARCPCCGSALSDRVSLDDLPDHFTGNMTAILRALRYGAALSINELCDAVYADDPEGGPEGAFDSVKATLTRFRPRLRALGWNVKASGGPGSRFRLIPEDSK